MPAVAASRVLPAGARTASMPLSVPGLTGVRAVLPSLPLVLRRLISACNCPVYSEQRVDERVGGQAGLELRAPDRCWSIMFKPPTLA